MKKSVFLQVILCSSVIIFWNPIFHQRVKAQNFEENSTEEIVEDVVRENLGIGDFIEGVLATVPVIIDKSKEVIEQQFSF